MILKNVYISRNLPHESSVRSGQAITPAEMQNLTNTGRAVSLASLESVSYYDDGLTDPDLMPLENTRGIDENLLWEASENSKEKIQNFRKQQKQKRESFKPSINGTE